MLNDKFSIYVDAYAYTVPDELREMEFRQWLESTYMTPCNSPEETYPQEQCVICLESAPNILYLNCMHIAVCDVCDEKKRTLDPEATCDVCRAEIDRIIRIAKKNIEES